MIREYHALARADVQHDDSRRWTLFGAFLVAEALLTTLLGSGKEEIVALLGMVSTLTIGVAIWRNNVYLRDRSILARRLERVIGLEEQLRFYGPKAQIPKERLSAQNGYGLFRNFQKRISLKAIDWLQAWATMRLTLATSFIAWTGVLLEVVGFPYVWTVITGLVGLVLLDWAVEIVQRVWPEKSTPGRD